MFQENPSTKNLFKDSRPTWEDEMDYEVRQIVPVQRLSSFERISEHSSYVRGTTLLKSLDHSGIDKDEADEITNCIEVYKKENRFFDEYYEEIKLTGIERGEGSIRVGHVLQVTSVLISNKSGSPWSEFKIYGEISFTDYENNTFYFYKRESDDAETISPECSHLSLNGWHMVPVMAGNVKFRLITTKDCGIQKFEGNYDVDYSIEDAYEKESTVECFNEDDYCATMVFNKIPYATLAEVGMYLKRSRQYTSGQSENFTVYGTIRTNKVLCFEKKPEEAVEMVHGTSIGLALFRDMFAVPTQSFLRAEVSIHSGDLEVADDTLDVSTRGLVPYAREFACKNRSYDFGIDVIDWTSPDLFFDPTDPRWMEDLNIEWSPDVSRPRQPPAASNHPLMEVYSVFVGGGDSLSAPALCGTIVVRNQEKPDYIFARKPDFPDDLSNVQFRTLSLSWPDRWVLEKNFLMHLKLKDDQSNNVCRGILTSSNKWNAATAEHYCDRRLCALIRGENGYFVAVHYSIFRNALRARVTAECEGGPCSHSLIYGSVVAEYNNYDYISNYNKEYYRNTIFKRSVEDCVKVKKGSDIPLSKSHISAPSDCARLIVYVNLVVCPSLVSVAQCSVGRISFEAGINKRESCGDITLNVEWEPKDQVRTECSNDSRVHGARSSAPP